MKNLLFLLTAACSTVLFAATENYRAVADTPQAQSNLIQRLYFAKSVGAVKIWPEGKIPLKANDAPMRFLTNELHSSNVTMTDVNDPTFTLFRAQAEGARPAVIVLPGGGYRQLGWNKEGTEIAEWLNGLGFSAAVLLYRVPGQRIAALCDVQRTIRLLRHDAAKYGVDPQRIGVIGFSAGANLAIAASTNWRKAAYEKVDAADDCSCRPDFQLPIYPWDIRTRKDPTNPWNGGWTGMKIRSEYPIAADTPPAFIAQSEDDFCQIETAVTYDYHLRLAGVSSTIRIYPNGGHGYGKRKRGVSVDVWSDEAAGWLAQFAKPSQKVLFLGDSITDKRHVGCEKNYWGFLGEWYGFHPYVYGINGQQMSQIPAQAKKYVEEHGNDADIVFIFAGTNDYNSNVPLGEWYSFSEEKTIRNGREVTLRKRTAVRDSSFRGRINTAILSVREHFPKAQIVMLTPLHRGYAKFSDRNIQPDESYANELGLFIDDYVQAVKESGNVWSVKVVDLNSCAGIYPNDRAHDDFLHDKDTDRLHPSTEGQKRMAEALAREVGSLL